jgi:glycosyltransferase involved in cell wall biosynthesis
MNPKPLVSAIIPAYNSAHFLPEAVASIRRQNYEPLEIIIVDDGSTDNTAEVVAGLGENVRSVYQDNSGQAAARNRGIKLARGDFLAFLDADDLWADDKLTHQLAHFAADSTLDIVQGRSRVVYLPGAETLKMAYEDDQNTLVMPVFGSALFRPSALEKVGLFDETMRYHEDADWFIRALEQNAKLRIIEAVTLYYRQHPSNQSLEKSHDARAQLTLLKRSLDRRRGQNNGSAAELPRFADFDETGYRLQPGVWKTKGNQRE